MLKQSNIKIRKFKKADLAEVKSLIYKTIDICYSGLYCSEAMKFFKDWYCDERILKEAKEGHTVVLLKNNQIIGTGTIVDDEIRRVFVEPAFQGLGFGRLIIRKLEEKAISLGIGIIKLDASIPSKKFYDSLGYVMLEETFLEVENNKRLDFYKMEKSLKKE